METLIQILHLEDDPADAELVQAKLAEAGLACRITGAQTRDEFETALRAGGTDIVLADYRLPTYDGMSALRLTLERCPEIPFIFVSGTMGEEAAIEGLTRGATDYVLKQNLSRLAPAIERALKEARNRRERRQAQEELQGSNEMLRAIIEAAPVAIIGLDLEGRVHSVWNPAAEKMLGWNAQDVMGRTLPTVPVDREEEFGRFKERLRSGMTLDGVEVRRQRRDGTPIDCSSYASPLHDAKGRTTGNITVLVDITQRKRAEAALKASEARYIDLYENAPDMYVSVNARTALIEKCNQPLADTLGCSKEEIIGRPVFDIYHPNCLDQAKEVFTEFLERGEIHDRELQLRKEDGSKLEVSLNVSAVRAADGAILSSRSTLRDITERRRNSMINAARLRLMQFAVTHSVDELLEETVNEAEKVTESLIGFYDLVDDDQQSLTHQNWSTRTKTQFCQAQGKRLHYNIADAGVWVDCVHQRKPVVHNDYMSLTHRKGLPEGHAEVVRELVVPVLRGEKIKAILGVGNKPTDYSEKDVEAMSLLADLVWEITERKQAEQQVALMSFALNSIHEAAFMIDENARFQYVNEEACRILGYSRNEMLTMTVPDIRPEFPMERWPGHWDDLKEHSVLIFEGQLKTRDGRIFPVEINANYFEYEGRSFDLQLARDITERKEAERERLANLRFFESMDKVNQAMQAAGDLELMMRNVLDTVIDVFDCDKTQLIYPCNPEAETWSVQMERTKPGYRALAPLRTKMPMAPEVARMHRISRTMDRPVLFGTGTDMPLAAEQNSAGNQSGMGMAIYPKNSDAWGFSMEQCSYPRIWTPEEMRVFEAIGRRLADGLSSLLSYRDLRKNEEFLNSVVEHIPNMLFVKDAHTLRFVRFNKAGEQLMGYSREELLGKTDHDVFAKDAADFFTAKDRQVIADRELVEVPEETIRNRSNEKRILHTKRIPILDETGAPQYLLGISEDITERKQAEESIRKLSEAIEQSPVSIVITDAAGSIEFVNAKFTQITGYSLAEALGQNPRILKSGETTAEEYRQLWKTISSGGVWQGEFHNRKKKGELFWEHATIAPIRNANNVITHYVAVKQDITERKKLEDQLRQSQRMEAIGQLAGGVAHDFNNMLGVIMGYAELALEKVNLNDPLREDLEEIIAAGLRSTEITRQLLAFARKQTIRPKVLDLNKTVEGMLKLLRRLIGEDIDLAWLPGANLWPVKMDPAQIDQILANLCVNARDAIAGVGKVAIQTQNVDFSDACYDEDEEFSPGEYVMLAVSDNGSGMDKRTLDKIFEPFFTTKGVSKGTGLGLATVYGIVKQNAGFIKVYSEPEHGSIFKIYLPRHAVKTEQVQNESPMTPTARGSETILLVEDDSAFLNMVKLMLEKFGYAVLSSSTPGEAIRTASKSSGEIDLLITDAVLPEMTGRNLMRNLSSLYPELKCLFMSGYMGNAIALHGVIDESVNFIQKPFSMQELAAKVREVLDSR